MTIADHTCITVACDICGYAYDEDEYTAHFPSLDDARKAIHSQGWTITADRKVICASGDTEHQAALDALMPPEPVMQVPGQLAIDGPEDVR
ncbi:hypothetical protein [Streptomyces sp. LUP30]|uniref:hypothetical protein n=1 Tax=Streptomyces sp. LUP30 TaxID=1890285 RepID=UPI0008519F2A|nr:hypothetical protein [Streptomyces sp. LUP30]